MQLSRTVQEKSCCVLTTSYTPLHFDSVRLSSLINGQRQLQANKQCALKWIQLVLDRIQVPRLLRANSLHRCHRLRPVGSASRRMANSADTANVPVCSMQTAWHTGSCTLLEQKRSAAAGVQGADTHTSSCNAGSPHIFGLVQHTTHRARPRAGVLSHQDAVQESCRSDFVAV